MANSIAISGAISPYGATPGARPATATAVASTAITAVATTAVTSTTPFGYTTSTQALALVTAVNSLITQGAATVTAVNTLKSNLDTIGYQA